MNPEENRPRQTGMLMAKVHQTSGRIFQRLLKAEGLEELNPAQGRLVFVLWQEDGLTMGQLAERTGLERSTLTSMVDRLEKSGQVERREDPQDRRKFRLYTTPASRQLHGRYEAVSQKMNSLFHAPLQESEADQLEELLIRLEIHLNLTEQRIKGEEL